MVLFIFSVFISYSLPFSHSLIHTHTNINTHTHTHTHNTHTHRVKTVFTEQFKTIAKIGVGGASLPYPDEAAALAAGKAAGKTRDGKTRDGEPQGKMGGKPEGKTEGETQNGETAKGEVKGEVKGEAVHGVTLRDGESWMLSQKGLYRVVYDKYDRKVKTKYERIQLDSEEVSLCTMYSSNYIQCSDSHRISCTCYI